MSKRSDPDVNLDPLLLSYKDIIFWFSMILSSIFGHWLLVQGEPKPFVRVRAKGKTA
jgi:hypothetical protein